MPEKQDILRTAQIKVDELVHFISSHFGESEYAEEALEHLSSVMECLQQVLDDEDEPTEE